MQHAVGDHGVGQGAIEVSGALQGLGVEAGDQGVAGVEARRDQGGGKARAARAGAFGLDDGDAGPAGDQGAGRRGSGDPRSDDGDMGRGLRRGRRRGQMSFQSLALPAVAGLLLDEEAVLGQAASHGARDSKGGDPRAGDGAGGDQGHDLWRPHAGVEGRREAVEEPGVGRAGPLAQRPLGVADGQVDGRAPLRQVQAVEAGRSGGPDGEDGGRGLGQLRPGGQGAGGLVAGQGEALDGEDMQAAVLGPGAAPQVQQGHDVQSRAEAQFGDGEVGAAGPGLWQTAAVQEDGASLGQTIVLGEIDVAEATGTGRAVLGPDELRRGVFVGGVGQVIGHGRALATLVRAG
ncbi:hypothetical protein D3C80_1188110 [compost metagenome]